MKLYVSMVRHARIQECVENDVDDWARPRRVTQWFREGNGCCRLCGNGPGKRGTRDDRKRHEQGYAHRQAHSVYIELFTATKHQWFVERMRMYRLEHELKRKEQQKALQEMLLKPSEVPELVDWLRLPDSVALKVALFDYVFDLQTLDELRVASKKHMKRAQCFLIRKAAEAALGPDCDPSHATTVSFLCKMYL